MMKKRAPKSADPSKGRGTIPSSKPASKSPGKPMTKPSMPTSRPSNTRFGQVSPPGSSLGGAPRPGPKPTPGPRKAR